MRLALFIFFWASFACVAKEENAPKERGGRSISALDNFHTFLDEGILKLANKVDYFFGRIRVDEESNETYGRFTLGARFQRGSIDSLTRIRLRLNLPGSEKKLKLIFDGEDRDEGVNKDKKVIASTDDKKSFDAALRYVVKRKAKFNSQFDGGVRISSTYPLNPYARLRNRFNWDIMRERLQLRVTNELYYFIKTYGQAQLGVDLDYLFKNDSFIRVWNFIRWEDQNDFFEFANGVSFYKELSDKRALGFHITAYGNTEFKTTYINYAFHLQYRRLLYKDWLFIDLKPEVSFPKERDFKTTYSLAIKFDILFGHY